MGTIPLQHFCGNEQLRGREAVMGKNTRQQRASQASRSPKWLRTGAIAKRDGAIARANHKVRKMGKLGPASECRSLTVEEIAKLKLT
jgi:hypothetical protein